MRVGFDEQIVVRQRIGGVSRYVVELIKALEADPDLGIEPVPGWTFAVSEHAVHEGRGALLPHVPSQDLRNRAHRLLNTVARRRSFAADVMHHTYYDPRYLRHPSSVPRVTTVYDMIPELFPQLFPQGNPHGAKREYVFNSDVVLCISESTKTDLFELYGDPGVPLVVTPLGVGDEWFAQAPTARPDGEGGHLLFVGSRNGYKDFGVLLRALAAIDSRWSLTVVGGGEFSDSEIALISGLGLDGRVTQTTATDAQMPAVYAAASVFVFPSRYEGFGLPTVEAMACGCPVVLARSSSHPEVGGDAAEYFPPQDDADLAAVLTLLLNDPQRREQMSVSGRKRARQYSWGMTARLTSDAYHLAVRGTAA